MKIVHFLGFFLCISLIMNAQTNAVSVVPAPASLAVMANQFEVNKEIVLTYNDESLRKSAEIFAEQLNNLYQIKVKIAASKADDSPKNTIALKRIKDNQFTFLPYYAIENNRKEAYKLTVNADNIEILGQEAGIFYGLQSLIQLIENKQDKLIVPCVVIADYPKFSWRGMHLDVCRHFFPVEFVKKYLDAMAFYKLNTFHWHLTEDQGWRIEIKKYPKLTEIGSKRKETMVAKNFKPYKGDGIEHGGFYTQEQIKEIVKYAADRQITVVPEIEMPGHALAALAAYPEYSCTGGPFEVATIWGVFDDVYCPKETTFQFLEDILTEVCALFPSSYIHIGGDEVPKERWKHCAEVQNLMKRENLKTEEEVQSYFIRRVEKILQAKGKRLIGWDEILEGGLAPDATVMSWRGTEGGKAAILEGHDAVMSPGSHCYFDHYQSKNTEKEPLAIGGYTPLKKIYEFQPDEALQSAMKTDPKQKLGRILGAQANVWTEYMATTDHVEYMVFPRLLALSEVVWSQPDKRKWRDFQKRLPHQLELLDKKQINYRLPEPWGVENDTLAAARYTVELTPSHQNANVFYSINNADFQLYKEPINAPLTAQQPTTIQAYETLSNGKKSNISTFSYYQAAALPALTVAPSNQGLSAKTFDFQPNYIAQIDSLLLLLKTIKTLSVSDLIDNQLLEHRKKEKTAVVLYETAYLKVPTTGVYTFYFPRTGDFEVTLDNQRVGLSEPYRFWENGKRMVAIPRFQKSLVLEKGYHELKILVRSGWEKQGGLAIEVESESLSKQLVPKEWLFY